MKKLLALILTLVLVAASFTGCNAEPSPTVFTKSGLTVTLTDRFVDSSNMDGLEDFTVSYISEKDNVAVLAIKEEFSYLEGYGIFTGMPLDEYARLTLENTSITTEVKKIDALTCFEYEDNGLMFFSVVYRGSDAYWLLQFSTEPENYVGLRNNFIAWAKTVDVGTSELPAPQPQLSDVNAEQEPSLPASTEPVSKDFQVDGMRIMLNDTFEDCTDDPSMNVLDFDAMYFSDYEQTLVLVQYEGFDLFEEFGVSTDISLEEYAQIRMEANALSGNIETDEGVVYFIYENAGNTYFATVHRGSDAYWFVQFATLSEYFDDMIDTYLMWAKTITF